MRLRVLLPAEVLVDEPVSKVIAEAENGSFCLLPRHVDFVAALVPGLLVYACVSGQERFLAIDEGILVKCGPLVLVSTRNAVRGDDLMHLREIVEGEFKKLAEHEKLARSALARLEASVVRRLVELR